MLLLEEACAGRRSDDARLHLRMRSALIKMLNPAKSGKERDDVRTPRAIVVDSMIYTNLMINAITSA